MIPENDGYYNYDSRYYRWWTVMLFKWGAKIGPISVFGYRWTDGRIRIGFCVYGHQERLIYGEPLS